MHCQHVRKVGQGDATPAIARNILLPPGAAGLPDPKEDLQPIVSVVVNCSVASKIPALNS